MCLDRYVSTAAYAALILSVGDVVILHCLSYMCLHSDESDVGNKYPFKSVVSTCSVV